MKNTYPVNDWRNYLEHHGIKGQKWGVQNGPPYPLDASDHSASEKKAGWRDSLKNKFFRGAGGQQGDPNLDKRKLAKWFVKDYKKNYDPSYSLKTSEAFNERAKDVVKDAYKKNKTMLDQKERAFLDAAAKNSAAEDAFYNLAEKYGKKYYKDEIKRNPDVYDTPRMKQKLLEYCIYESGSDMVRKERPDLWNAMQRSDREWEQYEKACKKVASEVFGSRGDEIHLHKDKWSDFTLNDALGDAVMSLHSDDKKR